ncbi:MAG: hypothetical protein D6696_18030 [Acidobacteria bacterium]|nr:MAG: hypothetical protein D6696_18030 [Acidobacteriota bacterium]
MEEARMRRARFVTLGTLIATLALICAACSTGPSQDELAAANDEEWAWLEETKATLDAKRAELQELQERLAGGGEGEGEGETEGEGEALTPEELQAKIDALQQEILNLADEFGARLVAFINEQGLVYNDQGTVDMSRVTERQLAAVRMKSSEDILTAREFIDKGGDYSQAISIYEQALIFDPDNEELKAALEEAKKLQFMTEERFAKVKKGMTQDEVRAVLGQVNLRNVHDFEDGKVEGWFYRKEDGGAAGVYFRKRKGEWEVYKADFNAIKPGS